MKSLRPVTMLQFILIISTFQISVAFLSIPRELARHAGTDGWMVIFLGWGLAALASIAIVKLMKYNPNSTILELIQRYIGVWAAKVASFIFMAYYLLLAYDGYMIASLVIKLWLLPSTYIYVLVLLLLIPTFQIAQHGFQAIGRYSEIVTMLSLWIPFIYVSTLSRAHWLYLLPLFKEGWFPVLSSIKFMIYPMLGIGLVLFLYPHLVNKEKALPAMIISNTLTCIVYLGITLICYVYFSPDEIGVYNDPVISIMKSIEFQFIERVEVVFIAFYLFVFSCIWIPSMYLVSRCSASLVGIGQERYHLAVWCIVIEISFFLYRPSFIESATINYTLNFIGFIMEFALPACVLLYVAIRKKRGRGKHT
ncbi:GerAB/ArcD/ProY family transporter [Paenibacillus xylanilyticus]|uniref:Endospore germination permease n=1 Tax=Paenibacillus xylanilyticus TaxID=248903 RepID=A0A7Y6C1F2_9BACL|nr:endospore germination permease [Paenibacillus xylanilyticus]NUU78842.1 endospore germination permease [Paenibacillus xylanilyticus]